MREIRGCVGLEQLPARGQVEQDGPAGWENMNFLVDCLRTTERAVASGPRPRLQSSQAVKITKQFACPL